MIISKVSHISNWHYTTCCGHRRKGRIIFRLDTLPRIPIKPLLSFSNCLPENCKFRRLRGCPNEPHLHVWLWDALCWSKAAIEQHSSCVAAGAPEAGGSTSCHPVHYVSYSWEISAMSFCLSHVGARQYSGAFFFLNLYLLSHRNLRRNSRLSGWGSECSFRAICPWMVFCMLHILMVGTYRSLGLLTNQQSIPQCL